MLNQADFKCLTSRITKFAQGYAIYMSWQIFFDHCNVIKFSVNLWPTVWECAKHFNTNGLETDLTKNELLDCGWRNSCGATSLLCHAFFNPLNLELNPICYLLALLAHHFLHVSRIMVKSLTLRLLMSYIYIWSAYS